MNRKEFIKELENIGVTLTQNQLEQLDQYYKLLIEWNNKMNLTNITEENDVYLKHFYDSLTLNKIVNMDEVESMCDIGTGAGFPGIVIKIVYPNIKVTLVDSLKKRTIFLNEVVKQLGLGNIEIYHERAEEFAKNNRDKYDLVTSRAVATLPILLEYSMPLVKLNKYFVAMKSHAEEEIENSKHALEILNSKIEDVVIFDLPIEKSQRSLIKIEKKGIISQKYPRSFNEIKKKHL